ncbi:MAG: GNAT family N-acetyltransferase [Ruminococcus sp.]|nr:GNAT family N-acetyltransferase [Ruminococcus sp.]
MTCYDIFRKCFPQFELTEEVFNRLSNINNIHLITHEEKGELCGFALVEKMALRLICVSPEYQNNGIGTTLLKKAENYIKQNGGNEILTGGASSQLLIGTPDNAVAFFKKDGFKIVGSCDEMTIDIHSFNSENIDLSVPNECHFDWFEGDFEKLRDAVFKVEKEWVQYFSPDSKIFCAFYGDEIASFCLVEYDSICILSTDTNKVGVIGCVGTIPEFRRKGIGLKMVALATDDLRKNGCDSCFIHYTGVANWYAKLGYETFLKLHFMKKDI